LDTPLALSDENGDIQWQASHTPFGETTVTLNNVAMNLRFPGQYEDEETGLHYTWNRYYDPSLGRFITSDPLGLSDGPSTYGYVHQNPVNAYDPDGLASSISSCANPRNIPACVAAGIIPAKGAANATGFALAATASVVHGPDLINTAIEICSVSDEPDDPSHAFKTLPKGALPVGSQAGASSPLPNGGPDDEGNSNSEKLPKHLRNKLKRIKNQTAAGGNRGISGSVTREESLALGRKFVGPNYRVTQTGNGTTIFRSSDGLRQFRTASPKRGINPNTGTSFSRTGVQVNFESRAVGSGRFTNNVHLDVIP